MQKDAKLYKIKSSNAETYSSLCSHTLNVYDYTFCLAKKAISLTLGSLALLHFCGGETRFSSAPSVGLCPPSPPLSSRVEACSCVQGGRRSSLSLFPPGAQAASQRRHQRKEGGCGVWDRRLSRPGEGGEFFSAERRRPQRAPIPWKKSCCSGKGRTLSPSVSYTPRPALLSSVLLWRLEGEGGKETTAQESVTHRDSPPKKGTVPKKAQLSRGKRREGVHGKEFVNESPIPRK